MDAPRSTTLDREEIERRLSALPMLPSIVGELMTLDTNADDFRDRVVSIAEKEPAIAARLLSVSNGVNSAPASPITSIASAVIRLGARRTANLLASFAVMEVFTPTSASLQFLWRHAIQSAVAAKEIAFAGPLDIDPQEAYVTGLLHDIGRFVMSSWNPDAAVHGELAEWSHPKPVLETEREECGTDHVAIGVMASRKWWLPRSFSNVIKVHHIHGSLEGRIASPFIPLVRVIQQAASVSCLLMRDVDSLLGEIRLERISNLGSFCICPTWETTPMIAEQLHDCLPRIRSRCDEQVASLRLAA